MVGLIRTINSLIVFTSLYIIKNASASEFGVLSLEVPLGTKAFCIIYLKVFSPSPAETETIVDLTPVIDQRQEDVCDKVDSFEDKIVLVSSEHNNCSLAERARFVQKLGGKGLLVAIPPGNVEKVSVNSSDLQEVNITVALISTTSIQSFETMFPSVRVKLLLPKPLHFDYSLLIIWAMAVGAVAVGSFWSGIVRHTLHTSEMRKLSEVEKESTHSEMERETEDASLSISPLWIALFVICMTGMLLLLYFFFSYLVYVIIAMFVLASIIAVFTCLEPLCLCLIPRCPCKLLTFRICCKINVHQVIRVSIAVALSVAWVVLRKESYSWVLQDLLGFAFCIVMLKSVRLPNLKICTLLLVLLFFYDIFFVFITPFLTPKGKSVMVEVATGGSSQEQLPMVLRVPHFLDPLSVCYHQYSLLGFGDILVPGLLVAYCHGMDMLLKTKYRVYYVTTVISYGLGLIVTFLGLYLMTMAQPALLYLVPATLIPLVLLSWARGELHIMWVGIKPSPPEIAEND